jgi:hypothetical protein
MNLLSRLPSRWLDTRKGGHSHLMVVLVLRFVISSSFERPFFHRLCLVCVSGWAEIPDVYMVLKLPFMFFLLLLFYFSSLVFVNWCLVKLGMGKGKRKVCWVFHSS